MTFIEKPAAILPGLILSATVGGLALGLEKAQLAFSSPPLFDGLVLSILLGTAFRSLFGLSAFLHPGIRFATKFVLELAIAFLGASVSFDAVKELGPGLFAVIVGLVFLALTSSYAIGRLFGLPKQLATLVACGNSICGNSAIVAAAPVIDARSDDVAASIAFTAALGIIVVMLLPFAAGMCGLEQREFGILAGMTVYSVPQIMAATAPIGTTSLHIGALVKLMRVLMLGPVTLFLGVFYGRSKAETCYQPRRFVRLVPWFIICFLLLMGLNSAALIPVPLKTQFGTASSTLTLVAMAALGLSVDIRTVMSSGGRVLATGTFSILTLAGMSLLAIRILS
ncbi:YeiH family protein [Emcibacter nanhaiensis]|uniref:Putative sulfate exporter family transporter n=1 Tax=Emcibacter nanhaiensis TaxID=1505037 RepID=A0A501PQH6_9PROT|nr:putative sulfate exporter family transporter [Emcibacter nanhaiensis]TPD62780.1 putative sulfate exporter family transporter [Emcibacter nanhaiensis]